MLDEARAVTSRSNPLVARFRAAQRSAARDVLLEGATLATEALRAGWRLSVLAVTDAAAGEDGTRVLLGELSPGVELVRVSPGVMEVVSPVRAPSGVVALANAPRAGDVFARAPALLVCAVDVQDPGNLGAIVRVAEAAGATGVIACGTSADPFGWKALRGAMGSAFRLPLVRRAAVDESLAAARRAGIRAIAATLEGSAPEGVDLRSAAALFVGSEGSGLPPAVLDAADAQVTVPMEAPVESLNVAVATAVLLYEARRQRRSAS